MFFIFYFNVLYAFICVLYSFLYILYELFVSFDDSIELLSSLNKFIYINYAIFLFPINEFDLLSYFLFFLRLKKKLIRILISIQQNQNIHQQIKQIRLQIYL